MHLVYIDDSKDADSICFAAVIISAAAWKDALDHLIGMRKHMLKSDGVYVSKELHATDWIAGRGNVARGFVPKAARARLFRFVLSAIARIPAVQIITAHGARRDEMILFERLLNRLDVNMRRASSHCVIISDEGKSYDALCRRMRRYNFVPSKFGAWENGQAAANQPLTRILEDIWYKDSAGSFFIQAADFCAFALLRMEAPTPAILKQGLQDAFLDLTPALVRQAYAKDPRRLGIVRAT